MSRKQGKRCMQAGLFPRLQSLPFSSLHIKFFLLQDQKYLRLSLYILSGLHPHTPECEGYEFLGWYLDKELTRFAGNGGSHAAENRGRREKSPAGSASGMEGLKKRCPKRRLEK